MRQGTHSLGVGRSWDSIAYMQLCGAMLYAKDLERMKRFYGDLLKVEPSNRDWADVWALFETGGVRFHLHAIPAGIVESFEIASPPVMRESEAVKLIFEVKDVEAERERLE